MMAAWAMWKLRKVRFFGRPILGLLMPSLTNAVFVGWELTVYIGGGFWLNGLYVAIGEGIVLMTLGIAIYRAIRVRRLDVRLFG